MPFLAQQHPQQTAAIVPVSAAPVAAPTSSAPSLLPLATPSLPAEHLQELKRQLAKSTGAAEAYLQTLDREEAALLLCEVLRRVAPHHRATRATNMGVILCCFALFAYPHMFPAFFAGMLRSRPTETAFAPLAVIFIRSFITDLLAPTTVTQRAAEILAREAQPALTSVWHTGPLLDAFQSLEVMRRRELQVSRARIVAALARLLPRLTASESTSVLTPKRRATLRHALRHARNNRDAYPADFTVAALLALATARDERAAVPAMQLRSSPSERIQAAAEECLRALEIIP